MKDKKSKIFICSRMGLIIVSISQGICKSNAVIRLKHLTRCPEHSKHVMRERYRSRRQLSSCVCGCVCSLKYDYHIKLIIYSYLYVSYYVFVFF